ncbi:MAG: hypothetical protein M3041_10045 [Acidobacteriota bacterium]|nr:hypothetical protein [Acidobacteriota bacterium]
MVTVIGPVVAPFGTLVEICVLLLTMKAMDTPLNFNDVVPLKFVPLTLTGVDGDPDTGKKLVIVGGPLTTKLLILIAVPVGVVTLTGPVVAATGTVAAMVVSLLMRNVALVPLNFTAVAPLKFVPEILTEIPTGPDKGKNVVIVGGAMVTVNAGPVPVPAAVVTVTGPVVAPAGTVVAICVSLLTMKVAAVPLSFTDVAPLKFEPFTLIEVPMGPEVGK